MKGATVLFFASITFDVTAIGCGSPSPSPVMADGGDAAVGQDGASLHDSGVGARCNPLLNSLCSDGLTCCFSGLIGTCTPVGACRSGFPIACTSQASCAAGEACCGVGNGASFALFCQSVCSAGQFQICRSDGECPAETTCVEVARGTTTMVCEAAPGTGPLPEDAGSDAKIAD